MSAPRCGVTELEGIHKEVLLRAIRRLESQGQARQAPPLFHILPCILFSNSVIKYSGTCTLLPGLDPYRHICIYI